MPRFYHGRGLPPVVWEGNGQGGVPAGAWPVATPWDEGCPATSPLGDFFFPRPDLALFSCAALAFAAFSAFAFSRAMFFCWLGCRLRTAIRSASSFFCCSASRTAGRGGGMSCTAGKSGAWAGRAGAPAGNPPIACGMLSIWAVEQPDTNTANATSDSTARPKPGRPTPRRGTSRASAAYAGIGEAFIRPFLRPCVRRFGICGHCSEGNLREYRSNMTKARMKESAVNAQAISGTVQRWSPCRRRMRAPSGPEGNV